jgi:hypothetical protein
MCIDPMQDSPHIFFNPKNIFNANYTNIHLLIEHDFIQIAIKQLETMQKVNSSSEPLFLSCAINFQNLNTIKKKKCQWVQPCY